MKQYTRIGALACAGLLVACGGGDDGPGINPPDGPGNSRGDLLSTPPSTVVKFNTSQMSQYLNATSSGQALLAVAGAPSCGVSVYEFEYATVGGASEATNATGAIMAPSGTGAGCSGPRPVLLYAHGTTTDRNYNIAQIDDASNSGASEGALIAAMYAARGYIVVAPNYAGYHKSKLDYHPYLHGDQQSKDMIDALSAARKAFAGLQIQASDKLLLSGYSQGGYVAMATHRALQKEGVKVTASAPMSGPYALAAFGDAIFYGNVNLGATVFVPMMVTSYQKAYGNLYSQTSDIFSSNYAGSIAGLLPSTLPMSTLFSQGKLPQTALFNSTPPQPSLSSITPPTTPAAMAPLFALGFGDPSLIRNEARLDYLNDAFANADGAVPLATTGRPATNPAHPIRKALKVNDLRDWKPESPVLMCGGNSDPTVFYEINTKLMQSLWTPPSALAPAAGMVQVLDVDSAASGAADPFAAVKTGFAQAKAATASQGGSSAVVQAYHGGLVPPFCAAAARGFFEQVLAR